MFLVLIILKNNFALLDAFLLNQNVNESTEGDKIQSSVDEAQMYFENSELPFRGKFKHSVNDNEEELFCDGEIPALCMSSVSHSSGTCTST